MTRDDLVQRLLERASTCREGANHYDDTGNPSLAELKREDEALLREAAAALAAPPAVPPKVEVYPNSDRGLAQMFPGVSVPLLRGIQEAAFRAGREDALKHMSPADLVAIVRDLQEADAVLKHVASARAMRRWHEALNKVVAYALERTPAAARVPDTPCKHCGGSGKYSGPPLYDPSFGDEEVCACGHHYYRHFDSYDEMAPVGCKYCECMTFAAPPQEPPR